MDALRKACDRGVIVVAITQCNKGTVSDAYETGRTLRQAGVVSGGDMTPEVSISISCYTILTHVFQCALTKLSYLLSKPELSVQEIRRVMGTSVRGEITATVGKFSLAKPNMEDNIDKVKGLLSQMVRLSARSQHVVPAVPSISVSSPVADESTAPWSWTAAEAVSTEEALIPFLVHLAVARDDIDGLATATSGSYNNAMGVDAVNCFDVSGRSPLHTAALHNSFNCATALLESGALVHLRDSLGHTPLYYVGRSPSLQSKSTENLRLQGLVTILSSICWSRREPIWEVRILKVDLLIS